MPKCTLSLNGIIKSCLETSTNSSKIRNTIDLRPKNLKKSQGADRDPKIQANRPHTIAARLHMTSKSTVTNKEDRARKSQMAMKTIKVIGIKMRIQTQRIPDNPTSR